MCVRLDYLNSLGLCSCISCFFLYSTVATQMDWKAVCFALMFETFSTVSPCKGLWMSLLFGEFSSNVYKYTLVLDDL